MSELLGAKDFGKQRANPYANSKNAVRINAVTQGAPLMKSYTKTVAEGKKLVSVMLNSVLHTFTDTILVEDTKAVEAALFALLSQKENDVFIRAKYYGGSLEIKYITTVGQLGVITLETAGAMSSAIASASEVHNWVQVPLEGGSIVEYDGTEVTLANAPYEFTGNAATDAATATQLATDFEADLTTAGGFLAGTKVTVDEANERFLVKFRVQASEIAKYAVDGQSLSVLKSYETFDALDATWYSFGQ